MAIKEQILTCARVGSSAGGLTACSRALQGGQQQQPPQQFEEPAAFQVAGGLTDPYRRSDRLEQSPPRNSTSPIKKFLNYFVGKCKTQRDIQVEQQRHQIKDKKLRDSMKAVHLATNAQPPRSPISLMPKEVEIPSVEEMLKQYEEAGIFDQFGNMFNSYLGIPSAPPPYTTPLSFPPVYGNFPEPSMLGYYGVPPSFPYPPYASGPGLSSIAPQSDFATAASESIFGSSMPQETHWTKHSPGGNGNDQE